MNGYNFAERLRKILAASRLESVRLKHEYVGTEHLLLALINEEEGVAAHVLRNLNANLAEIRQHIDGIVQQGKADTSRVDLPYTSRAKKVLELSMAEAARLNHPYVGAEHLLLGLLLEEKGIAAQVLNHTGIHLDAVRKETVRLLQGDPPELDALVAAPENHRLLMENDRVRVLDTKIEPGITTPLHTHRWPAAHYILSWSHFVRRDEPGNVVLDTRQTDLAQNVPEVLWGAPLPPHTLENVGSATLHVISVELKN